MNTYRGNEFGVSEMKFNASEMRFRNLWIQDNTNPRFLKNLLKSDLNPTATQSVLFQMHILTTTDGKNSSFKLPVGLLTVAV